MTDSLLMAVAAGGPRAVEDCLRRYSGAVWKLARRMSPTEHDAEDAVQEIFLDLWKSADRFDPSIASEITFVMTLARRRLIDRARRRGRAPSLQDMEEPEIIAAEPSADRAEVADQAALVRGALEELRPEQRQVLELALLHGQTHQEIAGRVGMPLGTVKSHARRGLMRIRQMLGCADDPSGVGRS